MPLEEERFGEASLNTWRPFYAPLTSMSIFSANVDIFSRRLLWGDGPEERLLDELSSVFKVQDCSNRDIDVEYHVGLCPSYAAEPELSNFITGKL